MTKKKPIAIGDTKVVAGRRQRFDIPVARLPTGSMLSMPVAVLNGRGPGPTVWLSGAIHGDELNGVEIIREVLPRVDVRSLRGSIIATPVVNVFGFIEQSRYLPDGRDLNRFFPGSTRGSRNTPSCCSASRTTGANPRCGSSSPLPPLITPRPAPPRRTSLPC